MWPRGRTPPLLVFPDFLRHILLVIYKVRERVEQVCLATQGVSKMFSAP